MDTGSRKKESVKFFQQAYDAHIHGDFETAVALYKKSIEAFPTPETFTFLGWALSFLNRYEEAIQFCKKAIQLDPDFGNPYNDIGAYLIEMEKLDEAIPYFEKALRANRYDAYHFPHYNLGRVYEKKGMIKKAREAYQKALQENPDYVVAQEAIDDLQFVLN